MPPRKQGNNGIKQLRYRSEVTVMGESPDGKLSGGARINTWLGILKSKRIKTNLVVFQAYSDKFKIEQKRTDELQRSTTVHFPAHWPRLMKGLLLLLFYLVYSWKSTKTSTLTIYGGGSVLLQLPANLVSKIRRKPLIFDYLDVEVERVPGILYQYLMRRISVISAISHYLVDKARSFGCRNVVYVPAFVDTSLFQLNRKARGKTRDNWGVSDNTIVIGYAGALAYTEGIPVLIQSLNILSNKHPELRLFVLGTRQVPGQGEEIFKLVKEFNLEDKVRFIPPVSHEEVPKFLSACDILCAPKVDCEINRAANPIKVVEYLSMGLPTVCSSVGETSRVIEHMATGFLAKPGDLNDLTEKLEWVVLNPGRAAIIGENGRKTTIEKYSLEGIENVVMRLLNQVTNGQFNEINAKEEKPNHFVRSYLYQEGDQIGR